MRKATTYTKTCPECGKVFQAEHFSVIYCSPECREHGSRARREAWKEQTHYNERRREKDRVRREQKKKLEAEQIRKRKEADKAGQILKAADRTRRLKDKAENGDLHSLMCLELEKGGNLTVEYWRAYKAAMIHDSERRGIECKISVNGVYIHDPDFAEEVIESIRMPGAAIYTRVLR